ncbi:hypothetical protein AWB71_06074 [Caballeronia peredens]|nr:hypothetical protein AWB71_06074 [Caballeronia peredens]
MAELDTCNCCETGAPATPQLITNRPGLSAIVYRIGSFASFRETMLNRLARELPELTTRAGDDHGITLLELWAAVADVLTFYQERIANEAYLRTAVQRDSVRRLAALLDYHPRPGLSAEADIAFTLDAGAEVTLAAGLRLMSLPGADQQPQIFETLAPCPAAAALNRLRARPVPVPDEPLSAGRDSALVETGPPASADGGPAPLAAGNRLALFTATAIVEAGIASVTAEDDAWRVAWTAPLPVTLGGGRARRIVRPLRFFGWNAPASYQVYDPGIYDAATKTWNSPPLWKTMPTGSLGLSAGGPWPLEARIERLGAGTALLVAHDGVVELATITAVAEGPAILGPQSDTVTMVTVTGATAISDRQKARLWEVGPADVVFRRRAYPAHLTGGRITLRPAPAADILPKRRILLDDGHGAVHAATVTGTAAVAGFADHLAIDFTPALPLAMTARDAVLLGNVVRAGHGETQHEETLGNGDGGQAFASFVPSQGPVSRRPSARDVRGAAALDVLVDGVRWNETPSLYGRGPDERVYTLTEIEDQKTEIGFGDGRTGARLPSGRGNVVARYRKGLGLDGMVAAGALNILLTRPPGLRDAANPAAAESGADPEDIALARENAPSSVRTFGRIVAIDDFARLATASGEIAKAKADWVWRALDRIVHLTVAAQGGGDLSSTALARLHAAMDAARDPNYALLLANALRVPVRIEAKLTVAPDRERDVVLADARAVLLDRLSFAQAELGRALHASQVIATLQATAGVLGVDLDVLHFRDAASWSAAQLASRGATARPDQPHLRLFAARAPAAAGSDPIAAAIIAAGAEVVPAEIATLADADLKLTATGGIG